MQERRNSIANALELHLSRINPSIGVVVFDNELFKVDVTQLHQRHSLGCNRVTPAKSGSLLNTTTYVLTLIMCAEFNCV